MKSYLLAAFGIIFFSVIVSFIIPQGKSRKIINLVIKIVCIVAIIQPLKGLVIGDEYNTVNLSDTEFICKVYSENQSVQLEKLIEREFLLQSDCTILIGYGEGNYIVEKVQVLTEIDDYKINEKIYAYLQGLGYINITVNDETY